jgi:aspartyl-tRNA(Asn)/glutamyl-tRNA(Gln) amidotransferase subunit B
MTEILRALSETGQTIAALNITPKALADLISLVEKKTINMLVAKIVFVDLLIKGGDPAAIVKEKGMAQVSDSGAIEAFADQAIAANPGPVADFKNGKAASLQFLIGQVMKLSKGKANPAMAKDILEKKLKS